MSFTPAWALRAGAVAAFAATAACAAQNAAAVTAAVVASAAGTAHHAPALRPEGAIAMAQTGPQTRANPALRPTLKRQRKPAPAPAADPAYGQRADITAFADDLATRRGLPRAWLGLQLAQARRVERVRQLIMPPPAGTAKNWASYRSRFIEPQRIAAGAAFWRDHAAWLALAEQRDGVPPEVVVGIVGVETFYGRITGGFRVLDALATLAFDFPPGRKDRSAFFRAELEEFFVFCARDGADPQTVKGSFAGAMGLPQFMPGSLNRHAVDLDGDGHIDLLRNPADVVGSVAHYLAQHGWQRGLPTHYPVAVPVDAADRAALLGPDILPTFSPAQMAERGAVLGADGRAAPGPLALIELQNGDRAPSYVAGSANFYAITRYNWSSYYAMAVIELGQAVAAARAVEARGGAKDDAAVRAVPGPPGR